MRRVFHKNKIKYFPGNLRGATNADNIVLCWPHIITTDLDKLTCTTQTTHIIYLTSRILLFIMMRYVTAAENYIKWHQTISNGIYYYVSAKRFGWSLPTTQILRSEILVSGKFWLSSGSLTTNSLYFHTNIITRSSVILKSIVL